MTWRHTGGGCCFKCDHDYPCGDDFENAETGERVRFYSTREAHFTMPPAIGTLVEIRDLDGVKGLVRIMGEAV